MPLVDVALLIHCASCLAAIVLDKSILLMKQIVYVFWFLLLNWSLMINEFLGIGEVPEWPETRLLFNGQI